MHRPKVTLRELFFAITIVGVALAWWLDRRHIAAELAALRHARLIASRTTQGGEGGSLPATVHVNRCATPGEFIRALRETKNWYEFADRTADPFVKTPIADEAVEDLIDLTKDRDAEVRTRAICTLGKMKRGADRIVPALIPCLDDSEPNVRWHAVFALSQFGRDAQPAIPAIRRQIADDSSPIAAFSARLLPQIDPTVDPLPLLIPFLESTSRENRNRAVDAISGSQRAAMAKPALVEAFRRETDPELRDRIATVIASLDAKVQGADP